MELLQGKTLHSNIGQNRNDVWITLALEALSRTTQKHNTLTTKLWRFSVKKRKMKCIPTRVWIKKSTMLRCDFNLCSTAILGIGNIPIKSLLIGLISKVAFGICPNFLRVCWNNSCRDFDVLVPWIALWSHVQYATTSAMVKIHTRYVKLGSFECSS